MFFLVSFHTGPTLLRTSSDSTLAAARRTANSSEARPSTSWNEPPGFAKDPPDGSWPILVGTGPNDMCNVFNVSIYMICVYIILYI